MPTSTLCTKTKEIAGDNPSYPGRLVVHAKTKVTEVLIHELLFADDAALTSHTEDGSQQFVHCLSQDCEEF